MNWEGILSLVATILLAALGTAFANARRFTTLEARFDADQKTRDAERKDAERREEERMASIREVMRLHNEQVGQRFSHLEQSFDRRFVTLEQQGSRTSSDVAQLSERYSDLAQQMASLATGQALEAKNRDHVEIASAVAAGLAQGLVSLADRQATTATPALPR